MQDYLKFLMDNAEKTQKAEGFFRCYCKILHEYHGFNWFDDNETPHIIDGCDAFTKYTEQLPENEESLHQQKQQTHGTSEMLPSSILQHR